MIINLTRMALVVSGMSCLPGDGITLWSWRPLCDQRTSVRSLNNYSLVTTSGAWSPGHCITGHSQLMFISLSALFKFKSAELSNIRQL